jgi:SpoVK/Ycf46/Vps4 family AAA+-type ATPase
MSLPPKWRRRPARGFGCTISTLGYARNVYRALDHRSLEAAVLLGWLAEYARHLGLDEEVLPEAAGQGFGYRRGVSAPDWAKAGAALHGGASGTKRTSTPLLDWLAALGKRLQLDALERDVLALALHYQLDQRVERLYDGLSECRGKPTSFRRDAGLLALLLGASESMVAQCLDSEAKLLSSGLLRLSPQADLTPLERLVTLLLRETAPATDIYDQLLSAAPAEALPWEAFAHLKREAEVAARVLQAALGSGEPGVNILLYGPPGTGKTAFAATLAAQVGAMLRPVGEADGEGREPDRNQRLAALRLAQRLAEPGQTVLLFDEAEDLFPGHRFGFEEAPGGSRVFIHRLLERMAVPVIWTANDISALGPAVLRRMTMCLELRVPNLATRTVLWRQLAQTQGLPLNQAEAERLARLVPTAPAVAETALRAARLAGGGAEMTQVILEGIARAVGNGLPAPEPETDALYDPALINADTDLLALETDLLRAGAPRAVSFLLAGPPSSGKSAWVRHLAQRMGMPLLQKRASDLLNAFVGGTEGNIAAAFTEARETGAFLVFDEADSLLLDRAAATRSWEISEVNEMLTWMESHPLPFACTTNLVERLDRASLRRFLVKLRFDWLTQRQARLAFQRFFGLPAPDGLEALRTLTPADFDLVRRRAALAREAPGTETLVRLLAAECEGRLGGRARLGFATEPAE